MRDSSTQLIKERIDIVGLIGESLPLKRAGSNFKARCPFHEEDTPSFMVSSSRQMYHCFGCSESGDVFSWLMKREGMSFPEALRVLAQRAGVQLTHERPERREERARLRETLDLAATFYYRVLTETADGRAAREYLERRGLTTDTIASWRLGYCSEAPTRIQEKARERTVTEDELVRTGVLHRGTARTFEFFHGRILFPLSDAHGSVVGLAGRVFESGDASASAQAPDFGGPGRAADRPKYINSPETALYSKSRVLYGLDRAKDAIRKENLAILVEGYTDVILSHKAGVTNVVATSGTALTEDHLIVLRRFTDRLAFAFDADAAGDAATRRVVDLALAAGFLVSVVLLPEGDDPADLAVRDAAAWRAAIAQRQEIFAFLLERALRLHRAETAEGKKAILVDLLPIVARIPDAVVVGKYVQELAVVLQVEPRYVSEDLRRWKASPQAAGPRRSEAERADAQAFRAVGADATVRREERLLVLLLGDPTLLEKTAAILPETALDAPHTRALYKSLLAWHREARVSPGALAGDVSSDGPEDRGIAHRPWGAFRASLPDDLQRFLEILLFVVDVDRETDEWQPAREARTLIRDLRLGNVRRELRAQTERLRQAAPAEREELMRAIASVTRAIAQAERFEW